MKLDSRQESARGAAHGKANANELGLKDAARVRLMPSPTKIRARCNWAKWQNCHMPFSSGAVQTDLLCARSSKLHIHHALAGVWCVRPLQIKKEQSDIEMRKSPGVWSDAERENIESGGDWVLKISCDQLGLSFIPLRIARVRGMGKVRERVLRNRSTVMKNARAILWMVSKLCW